MFKGSKNNLLKSNIFSLKALTKMIPTIILVLVMGISIGYSALSSTMNLSSTVAKVRVKKDVRITNVSKSSTIQTPTLNNNGSVNYLEYSVENIKSSISLPNNNSAVAFNVEITNIGNVDVGILKIDGLPNNLDYDFEEYTEKDKICDNNVCKNGITKEIRVIIKYKDSSYYDSNNKDFIINIVFDFEPFYNVTYTKITGNYPTEVLGGDTLNIDFGNNVATVTKVRMNNVVLSKGIDYTYVNKVLNVPNVTGNINIAQEEFTLIAGSSFNARIKRLANNNENLSYGSNDTTIKTIGFYTEGKLPEGYTLQQLQALRSTNVTASGNTITAYYDENGNIFIYSEGLIRTNTSLSHTFAYLKSLTTINNLASLNTSNTTTMNSMFYASSSLTSLDLSSFDTSSVTDMYAMFTSCTNLSNINLSSFNTSNVTTMESMFFICTSLTSLNLSNFNTSSVTNMTRMFARSTALTSLNLSNFTFESATTTEKMFHEDNLLTYIDLSKGDISGVTTYSYMFNKVPTSATIKLKDTASNRTFMSTNFPSYSPTYINN